MPSRVQLCDPKAGSLPSYFVYGISQARILEWVVIPFARGSSQPREGFPSGSDHKESACHAETRVQSLDQEDSLKKGMATHCIVGREGPFQGLRMGSSVESEMNCLRKYTC